MSKIFAVTQKQGIDLTTVASMLKSSGLSEAGVAEQLALRGFSKDAVQAAMSTKQFNKDLVKTAIDSTKFTGALGDAEKKIVKTSKGLKGLGTGLKNWWSGLGGFAKFGVIAGAAVTAGAAIYKIADHFITNTSEAQEKLSNAISERDANTAQIEQLEGRLTEVRSRIEEIQGLGTLTIVEQDELDDLKAESLELEHQIRLLKEKNKESEKTIDKESGRIWKNFNSEATNDLWNSVYTYENGRVNDGFFSKAWAYIKQLAGVKSDKNQLISGREFVEAKLGQLYRLNNELAGITDGSSNRYSEITTEIAEIQSQLMEPLHEIENINTPEAQALVNKILFALADREEQDKLIGQAIDNMVGEETNWADRFAKGTQLDWATIQTYFKTNSDEIKDIIAMCGSEDRLVKYMQRTLEQRDQNYAQLKQYAVDTWYRNASPFGSVVGASDISEAFSSVLQSQQELAVFEQFLNGLSTQDLAIMVDILANTDQATLDVNMWKQRIEGEKAARVVLAVDMDKTREELDKLYSTFSEASGDTGLSDASINTLRALIPDGEDQSKYFTRTAMGIRANTQALRELEIEREQTRKNEYEAAYAEKIRQYADAYARLSEIKDHTSDAYKDQAQVVNSIADEITKISMLRSQYDGLTSAYYRWLKAKETPNEDVGYEGMRTGWDETKDLYEKGLVGYDEFIEYVDSILGGDRIVDSAGAREGWQKLQKTLGGTKYKVSDFLTEDYTGGVNFMKYLSQVQGDQSWVTQKDGQWSISIENLGEVAQKTGLDVEFLTNMMYRLKMLGADIEIGDVIEDPSRVTDWAISAQSAIDKLVELGILSDNTQINIDVSTVADAEAEITKLESLLEPLRDPETGHIDLTLDGAEEARTLLVSLIKKKQELQQKNSVLASGDLSSIPTADYSEQRQELNAKKQELVQEKRQIEAQLREAQKTVTGYEARIGDLNNPLNPYESRKLFATKQQCEQLEQQLASVKNTIAETDEALANLGKGSGDINTDNLQALESLLNLINEREVAAAHGLTEDVAEYDKQIQGLVATLGSLDEESPFMQWAGLFGEDWKKIVETIAETPIEPGVELNEDALAAIQAQLASITAEDGAPVSITLDVDDTPIDEATSEKTVNTAIVVVSNDVQTFVDNGPYDVNVRAIETSNPIRAWLTEQGHKYVTVHETHVVDGAGQVDGTAHFGYAFVGGTIGRAYAGGIGEVALGGELGRELLVRNGRFMTIGQDSAQLFVHKPGDIIFNAQQTEQIIKYGRIRSGKKRGKAYAEGNAYNEVQVSGGWTPPHSSSSASSTKRSSSSKKSSSSQSAQKAASDVSKAAKDTSDTAKKALDSFKEETGKLYDWIETVISNLEDKIDKYLHKAEKRAENGNYSGAANQYLKAQQTIAEAMGAQAQAQEKYAEQAEAILRSAVSKGVISSDLAATIRNRVANGTMDISSLGDNTKEVVSAYSTYADKAKKAADATIDLYDKYEDVAESLYNLPIEQAKEKIDKLSDAFDLLEKRADATNRTSKKQALMEQQIANQRKQNIAQQKQESEAAANYRAARRRINESTDSALAGLSADAMATVLKSVQNNIAIDYTSLTGITDKGRRAIINYNAALKAQEEALQSLRESNLDTAASIQELAENIAGLATEKAEDRIDRIEKNAEVDEAFAALANTALGKNYYVNRSQRDSDRKLAIRQQAVEDTKELAKNTWKSSGLQAALLTAANQGKAFGERLSTKGLVKNSKEWTAVTKYNAQIDALAETRRLRDIERANNERARRDNALEKFNNRNDEISKRSEKRQTRIDRLRRTYDNLDLAVANGEYATMSEGEAALQGQITKALAVNAKKTKDELAELKRWYDKYKDQMSSAERAQAEEQIRGMEDAVQDAQRASVDWLKQMYDETRQKSQSLIDLFSQQAGVKNARIDLAKATGKQVTAADYDELIALSEQREAEYVKQRQATYKEIRRLKAQGLTEDDEEIIALRAQAAGYNESILGERQTRAGLNQDKNSLLTDQIQFAQHEVETLQDEIQDAISLREAIGKSATSEDYRQLIELEERRRDYLREEADEYERQLQGLDKNSDEYHRIKQELDGVNDQIRASTVQTEQWARASRELDYAPLEYQLNALQNEADIINDRMSLADAQGLEKSAADYQALIANSQSQVLAYQQRRAMLYSDLAGLDVNDPLYQETLQKIWECDDAIRQAAIDQAKWTKEAQQLEYDQTINKIKAEILDLQKVIDSVNNRIKLIESKGLTPTLVDYEALIEADYRLMEAKEREAQAHLDAASQFEEYSAEWTSAQNAYLSARNEAESLRQEIQNLSRTTVRDNALWKRLEREHTDLDAMKNIMNTYAGMFNEDMMYKDGKMTTAGNFMVENAAAQYRLARTEVQRYADDIRALNSAYNAGLYSADEYHEKLLELQQSLSSSQLEVKKYADQMVSMLKQQGQSELDYLGKLIEARSEALQKKQEYYDYDKTIRGKTKDIQALQAQIAALDGVTDAESRAKRAQLQAQLAEAQEDLDDTIQQHQFELSREALSELTDVLQEAFDEEWKKVTDELDALIAKADELATDEAIADAVQGVKDLLEKFGVEGAALGQDTTNYGLTLNALQTQSTTGEQNHALLAEMQSTLQDYVNWAMRNGIAGVSATGSKITDAEAAARYAAEKSQKDKSPTIITDGETVESVVDMEGSLDLSFIGKAIKDFFGTLKNLPWFKPKGYASGSKRITKSQFAWTQEKGGEWIVRASDGAILTPLSKGDGVLPADLTERLWKIAAGQFEVPQIQMPEIPEMHGIENYAPSVTQHYDALIHVDGNVDKNVVDELKETADDIVKRAYQYTSEQMYRGYLHSGGKRRI